MSSIFYEAAPDQERVEKLKKANNLTDRHARKVATLDYSKDKDSYNRMRDAHNKVYKHDSNSGNKYSSEDKQNAIDATDRHLKKQEKKGIKEFASIFYDELIEY